MSDEDDDALEPPAEVPARLFSVEEANAMLPVIEPLLRSLREANTSMEDRGDAVMESIPTNGGGTVHREFVDAAREAGRMLDAITSQGVIVRDPESGLIDFPTDRDGEIVFLCWRLGEAPAIEFWHPTDTGFAGRRPLD